MPMPRSATTMATRSASVEPARRTWTAGGRRPSAAPASSAAVPDGVRRRRVGTASRALVSMLTSACGAARRRCITVTPGCDATTTSGGQGPAGQAACAASRHSRLRSAARSSKRIGRAKSSTSLTMRLSRATSSSMSATRLAAPRRVGDAAAQRAQRRLDDHQRVADLVGDHGRQAAERRQPLASAPPRAGSARSSRSARRRCRRGAARPRPPSASAGRHRRASRSPVAAISRIVAVIARERPRHRARHGVAQERRDQHRDGGRGRQRGVQLRRKARRSVRDAHDAAAGGPGPAASAAPGASSRAGGRDAPVLLAVDRQARDARPRRARRQRVVTSAGSVDACTRPPSTNTTSLWVSALMRSASASSRLKPTLSVPSTSGCADDADRHGHDLEHAARARDHRTTLSRPASAASTSRWSTPLRRQPGLADDGERRCPRGR